MKSCPQRKVVPVILIMAAALIAGCGDPIYDNIEYAPVDASFKLPETSGHHGISWPLQNGKYVVVKPPNMEYLTSFEKKYSFDDQLDAPLVPWDDMGLSSGSTGLYVIYL